MWFRRPFCEDKVDTVRLETVHYLLAFQTWLCVSSHFTNRLRAVTSLNNKVATITTGSGNNSRRKNYLDFQIYVCASLYKQMMPTYKMFTPNPMPAVISMISAFILKSFDRTLITARYTNTPVNTQMMRTDTRAPSTSKKRIHENNQNKFMR